MKAILPIVLALAMGTAPAAMAGFTRQLQFGTSGTIPVAWGDFDNDGDADLAVGDFSGQNYLYVNNGDGTFTEQAQFGNRGTFALAWGDWDNNGLIDMAVGNNGGANPRSQLCFNNGDGTFTCKTRFGQAGTIAMAWADFDLDGDIDMALGNGILGTAEQNELWINNADSSFTETSQFGMGQSCTIAWGDYDNDGDPDLAVGNWNGGQNYLYVNNGDGTFTEQAKFGRRDPNTLVWGDYDNDGDLDLAVGNGDFSSADSNFIYVNNSDGTFTEVYQLGDGSTDALAWADYDNDGDIDVGVGNEHHPAQNWLYVNDQDDSASLRVRLLGHRHDMGSGYSNREGIGAKVAAYESGFAGDAGHLLGYREIDAHGGFSSQCETEAHFGLPGETTVDVRVQWPGSDGSYLTEDFLGIPATGKTTLEEGSTLTGVAGGESIEIGSLRLDVAPNPVRSEARFSLHLPEGAAVGDVEIYSVAGRLVRTLHPAAGGSGGLYHSEWDGRDSQGASLPSGVYFAIHRGGVNATRRIVLLR